MRFFIILLLAFSTCLSQNPDDTRIKTETEKLTLKGISEFFFLEKYCVGCISLIKNSESDCTVDESRIFLFWKENEESFVQKISKCPSKKKKISKQIIQTFIDYKSELEIEKIKKYSTKPDSITEKKIYSFTVGVSHSTFTKFYFFNNKKEIIKKIDAFDLTTNSYEPNIYYDRNKSLKIIALKEMCEKEIKKRF